MLIATKDRKVTNRATPNGKIASIANTFCLPSGKAFSCPDATEYCSTICYAGRLEKVFKGFRNNVLSNWEAIQGMNEDEMVDALSAIVYAFHKQTTKWIAKGEDVSPIFRIHADGDFFSEEYTNAWLRVIDLFDDIQFWVYTRSAVAAMSIHRKGLKNVALYFSSDPQNVNVAAMLNNMYGINIAHVDETFDDGEDTLEGWGIKAVRCPENNGSLPLISEKGSACDVCGLCVNGRANVRFSRTKK